MSAPENPAVLRETIRRAIVHFVADQDEHLQRMTAWAFVMGHDDLLADAILASIAKADGSAKA